ncbi:hypothetical protein D3C76_732230 [compost metagenome]|uniref:Uncharacterized protein n=1 Tax=Pseudomonas jinjuensis TaxID=198616 RepID=A0A1G9Z3Z4_9PSED|nr:hypothetical protein [Pseudomonas jinjuensis]SDN15675.1 hypothetical protein SAMN05216193_101331 [Pseudomonas jinjuensis]
MSIFRYFGGFLLVTAIGYGAQQLGETLSVPGLVGFHLIPPAEAVIGRPLTPVSVAGVARRTARRCAVGVYNC